MSDALIALHFQNDTCHPDGAIPFSLERGGSAAAAFLAASAEALAGARANGWAIAHVHIGFAPDYSDLPRNARLFLAAEQLGAMQRDSWGAHPFAGFEPRAGEIVVTHSCNSAFRRTALEAELRSRGIGRLHVMGLATQFSVEHTVRDAADMGFRVHVLSRCCASGNPEAHRASLAVMSMLADVDP